MKHALMIAMMLLLFSCKDKYTHDDYANVRVVDESFDCHIIVDNSAKRDRVYQECRDKGSWDITCGDRARSIYPDQRQCNGTKRFVQVWLGFPRSQWSDLMDCSKTDDFELKRACETR